MIWWIALGILTLIAIMPVGISGVYDEAGPVVRLILGPVRLQLYPTKQKEKKEQVQRKQVKKLPLRLRLSPRRREKAAVFPISCPLLNLF